MPLVKYLNRSTNIITSNIEYTIDPQSNTEETTLYYYTTIDIQEQYAKAPLLLSNS
jgi:hypothetical protein